MLRADRGAVANAGVWHRLALVPRLRHDLRQGCAKGVPGRKPFFDKWIR